MRVLQIIPAFRVGGAEIMVENLLVGLKEQGHESIAISFYTYESAITKRLEENGIKIYYLNKKKGIDVDLVLRLRRTIKKIDPDVIHTHLYTLEYVVLATTHMHIPTIHTVHNVADKEVNKIRQYSRQIIFRNKKVFPVSISPIVADSIVKLYKLRRDSVPMIYNGIDLRKCKMHQNYELSNKIQAVNIGRLEEQKNQKAIVEAICTFNKTTNDMKIKLQIIGEGSKKEELVDIIQRNEAFEDIELSGEKDSVYDDLSKADIFLLPSKWEGMPITLIEAMQSGVPIIASGVGGIRDMVVDGYSGLICGTQAEDILNAIREMIKLTADQREKMSDEAKNKSQSFSRENMCSSYVDLYKKGICRVEGD